MEITESQLSIVLEEALTCFLAFLLHTQTLRESKLPRRGKGIETTADVSSQKHYESRVAAAESCLKYTSKIARSVRKWNRHAAAGSDDEATPESEIVSFRASLSDGYEASFLDMFSGNWIPSPTPFTAGPSSTGIEHPLRDKAEQCSTHPEAHRQRTRRRVKYKTPVDICREGNFSPTRRSISIHPNVSIAQSILETRKSSPLSSAVSRSTEEPQLLSSISSVCRDGDDIGIRSNMTVKLDRNNSNKREDQIYAETIQLQDRDRQEESAKRTYEAQRLSDQLVQEGQFRLREQEKYAKKLEQEEKERAEEIRKNREAAQKAQQEWEMAAIARETEAMRLEERERRHQEEMKRVAEEQRKQKIQREIAWAAEIQERNRKLSEEKKLREAENIARRQREQRERESKARLPRKVDCVSCMEAAREKDTVLLPCNHAYCGECIKGAFKSAYKSKSPFKCCGTSIPTSCVARNLPSSFIEKYNLMVLELNTKKPKYCSSSRCHKFIPPTNIHGPIAACPYCKTKTCVACGTKEHSGVCAEDKAGKAVEALAQKKGWKQCPKCSQILERTEGCLHMTCRCKAEWCYSCLRSWNVCRSTCGRATPFGDLGIGPGMAMDMDMAGQAARARADSGRAGLGPVITAAVLMSLFND